MATLTSWSSDEWRIAIRPPVTLTKKIHCRDCGLPWIVDEDSEDVCPRCQERQ